MAGKKKFPMLFTVCYSWEEDVEAENEVEAALIGGKFADKRMRANMPKGRLKHKYAGAMFRKQWLMILKDVAEIAKKDQAAHGKVDFARSLEKAEKTGMKAREFNDAFDELVKAGKLKRMKGATYWTATRRL